MILPAYRLNAVQSNDKESNLFKYCRYGFDLSKRICSKIQCVGEYKKLPDEVDGIVPFIITDDLKMFYYRVLQNWPPD